MKSFMTTNSAGLDQDQSIPVKLQNTMVDHGQIIGWPWLQINHGRNWPWSTWPTTWPRSDLTTFQHYLQSRKSEHLCTDQFYFSKFFFNLEKKKNVYHQRQFYCQCYFQCQSKRHHKCTLDLKPISALSNKN